MPLRSHTAADPVVVLGSINIDLILELDALPAGGETVVGRRALLRPGGKGANQAVAAALAGASVRLVGRVGDDEHARTVLSAAESCGVDVSAVQEVPGESTGVAMVMVTGDGENAIVVSPGANAALRPEDVEELRDLLPPRATLLLQMEVPLDVVVRACRVGAEAGATVVVNLAPAAPLPEEVLGLVDVLVVNRSEAGQLAGRTVADVASATLVATELREMGPRSVVVTLGSEGAVLADQDGSCHVPAQEVDVLDTTGAGDAFVGALAAWMGTHGLRGAVEGATRVAAKAVRVRGARMSADDRVGALRPGGAR